MGNENDKKISIGQFVGAIASIPSSADPAEGVILPIENLNQEDRKEIDADLEREESSMEIGNIEIKTILGVIPLEPVVIMASLDEEKSLGDMKTIGIPGFLNPATKGFFLLDGSLPLSKTLRDKVKEYIENR